jgi:hypothetical protein
VARAGEERYRATPSDSAKSKSQSTRNRGDAGSNVLDAEDTGGESKTPRVMAHSPQAGS